MPKEAAQHRREQTIGRGVPGPNKHTMNSEEQQEELQMMQNALAALAADKPELLHGFMDAFSERSQFPDLAESHREGLTRVLSRLLWTYVPERYFEKNVCGETSTPPGPDQISRLSSALAGVARRHPFVIDEFRRIREERKITIQSALDACLRYYVDNRTVFSG